MIELESLLNHAKALYRQREGCLQKNRVDMSQLLDVEARLREHIYALSRVRPFDDAEPDDAADAFIYIAKRLIQSDKALQAEAAEYACELLLEPDAKSGAARNALLLFPSKVSYQSMYRLYKSNEYLRAVIIYILTQQSASLPDELIKQAELTQQDPLLQAQILNYAANDIDTELSLFSDRYTHLIDQIDPKNEVDHAVLLASIWGGMVRQDPESYIALRRAIENESDDLQRLDFLRLAALSGDEDYYPILSGLIEYTPAIGYYFLALHGSRESVEIILTGLQHPRTSEYAEEAWWLSTGQVLAKIPRISVIGEEETSVEQEEEIGFIPDAGEAEQWWDKNASKPVSRWLAGESHSLTTIQNILNDYGGQISTDLFDLYSLAMQSPVQIGQYNWHAARLQKLKSVPDNATLELAVQHA